MTTTGKRRSQDVLLKTNGARRLLGAFYTPSLAAEYMADWAIRADGDTVLEPSFGNGIFLRAVRQSAIRKNLSGIRMIGVEIDARPRTYAIEEGLISPQDAWLDDFLNVEPVPVRAVIGNPPYVRLRKLPSSQSKRALQVAAAVLGEGMDPSGSLWMPFVLHAMRFLERGGRLAFVLPYDFTYVRYARPLWKALRERFGSIRVLRSHERIFPDLLQDVVILLADDYGCCTDSVRFQAFERVDDLLHQRPVVDRILEVDRIIRGERLFVMALLCDELRDVLAEKIQHVTFPARTLVKFNIGYVAGDKSFFHPSEETVRQFGIPPKSLHPALTSTRAIRGMGLRTSSVDPAICDRLFLPDANALTAGERKYITYGEAIGISERYKCRVRKPWFVVPGVRVPDIIISVFAERPLLRINDGGFFASNSLLCGYSNGIDPAVLAAAWYTSLTLLHCEIEVHALGGGVMVVVPREAGNIRIPRVRAVPLSQVALVDSALRAGRQEDAFQAGDQPILVEQLGLDGKDIDLIREGVEVLSHWRTSSRASSNGSD